MVLRLNKFESPSTRDDLCKVGLKMASWFRRRRFSYFVDVSSLFHNYLPFEKDGALHLNKLDSPSPKDAMCLVWLKLAKWFWRRRFLNFVDVFSIFYNYHPLQKGGPFI